MTPAPAFHENWFSDLSCQTIAELARITQPLGGIVVEIGAWEGRSSVALANACYPRSLYTCDTWNGDGHPTSSAIAADRDVHAQWLTNMAEFTQGNYRAHRCDWRKWVPTITEPVSLAFIDADHSYREVYDNIAALIPHMLPGGIMCGDDAHYGPVQDAVFDLLGVDDAYILGQVWIWQVPSNPADLDAVRLRAINEAFAPRHSEFTVDLERTFRLWRRYVNDISAPDMAASHGTLAYMVRLCEATKPRRILDLGSGLSSAVFRKWAATQDYPVDIVSVDTDAAWLLKTRDFLISEELDTEGLHLYPGGAGGKFDLVFHDIAGGDERNTIAAVAADSVADGGFIVWDDCQFPPHLGVFEAESKRNGIDLYSLAKFTFDAVKRWSALGIKGTAPATAPPATSDLARKYAKVASTESDIWLHLPRFLELVEAEHMTKVIELGTRTGVSTIAWLHALEQTGGHLWSVDIDAKPPIGDYPHWTFIQGDDEAADVLAQLPEQVDAVFLDTSHHFEHTLRELRLYRSRVRPGGYIVCHDTELDYPEGVYLSDPPFPVRRAIEQFVAEHGLQWLNIPECYGLGIIKVV